jgi:hypothetical protein
MVEDIATKFVQIMKFCSNMSTKAIPGLVSFVIHYGGSLFESLPEIVRTITTENNLAVTTN